LQLSLAPEGSLIAQIKVPFALQDKVLKAHWLDVDVGKIIKKVNQGVETYFHVLNDGLMSISRQIYLPDDKALKEEVL
jgi:hypothetical protein